jgi:flagellar motor switch protein FliN/FliY
VATGSDKNSVAQWALGEFGNGFASAIEGMAGVRPDLSNELLSSAPPEGAVPSFRWKQPMSGIPGDALAFTSEPDTLTIGQHVMVAAGVENSSPDDLKSTFQECLGQAFSLLTRAMTTRLQREVTPAGGQESPPTQPSTLAEAVWGSVRLVLGDQPVTVFLGLPPQMLEPFVVEVKAVAQAAGAGNTAASTTQPAETAPVARSVADDSRTFDLLLDVELPVSVSFGHAQVPLKDVLKLTTGSIVELSRAIIEPVDIVVNNCVIAKGEVVVVEGNFGVRIQHVISRSERLRSLQ